MRKISFVLGFGVGYVLGARAGRERYRQIVGLWDRLAGSPQVREVTGKAKETASAGARQGLTLVQRGVVRSGEAVRERLSRSDPGDGYSR